MDYSMKMLAVHRRQLRELLSDTSREQACFLVCSIAQGDDETTLLVRSVLPLDKSDLQVHAHDQLSVDPAAMLRMARKAQHLGGAICMVHTHPMCSGGVEFSRADDLGNERTFEFYSRMLPGQLNSCLVWDGPIECVAGRVYITGKEWHPLSKIECVNGEFKANFPKTINSSKWIAKEQFDRQSQLLGEKGQEILSSLRIGIIGCGGIGSVAATLLVHGGVRYFTLVDYDMIEPSNLPRIIGASPDDIRSNRHKTGIVKQYVQTHEPSAHVVELLMPVEYPSILGQLVDLDAIICCTDDTTSRAYLNQLCHQYYVPILDLGVQFGADPTSGKIVKEIGRANLMLPGTPCMCCTGQIDPAKLTIEGLTIAEQQSREREGYIAGADVSEPSMMMFNMQVTARGIQRLLEWFTGFQTVDVSVYDSFRFFGLNGEAGIKHIKKRSRDSCLFCGDSAQYAGIGDIAPMLTSPRH